MTRVKVNGKWESGVTINPYDFYYYSIADNKHYTADEYGNEICKRTRNKLNDRIIEQVRKNMKLIRYVKDSNNNCYYDNDGHFTFINFDNQQQVADIYNYQYQDIKKIEYNARQELIK